MKIRIPEKISKVLKFEAKLLVGVAVLGVLTYFGTHALIAKAAEMVVNAYTSGF